MCELAIQIIILVERLSDSDIKGFLWKCYEYDLGASRSPKKFTLLDPDLDSKIENPTDTSVGRSIESLAEDSISEKQTKISFKSEIKIMNEFSMIIFRDANLNLMFYKNKNENIEKSIIRKQSLIKT